MPRKANSYIDVILVVMLVHCYVFTFTSLFLINLGRVSPGPTICHIVATYEYTGPLTKTFNNNNNNNNNLCYESVIVMASDSRSKRRKFDSRSYTTFM